MENSNFHEVVDKKPMAIPVRFNKPASLQEMFKRIIHQELSKKALEEGNESIEEADDFDVNDDPELKSPYELDAEVSSSNMIEEAPAPKKEPAKEPAKATDQIELPVTNPPVKATQ